MQELAKDMEMRWSLMTEKRQDYLGRSLSRTTKGYLFGVAVEYAKQLCTDFGFGELEGANYLVSEKHLENDTMKTVNASTGRCLAGCSGWIVQASRTQCVSSPRTLVLSDC